MTRPPLRVLFTLTRPPPDPERWAERGLALIHAPALRVAPLPLPLDRVRARLGAGAALVLYSRHALAALAQAELELRGARVLCVGPRLAERAHAALPGARVETPDPGGTGFEAMAQAIARDPAPPPSFIALGLRGAPRPLAERLGAEVEIVDAYESLPNEAGAAIVRATLERGEAWVALGSPRAALALAPLIGRAPVCAIGHTTEEAAREAGLEVRAVAREPSAEALLRSIAQTRS